MNTCQHFAVIGAGIVGLCSGIALLNQGHRVTFIDGKGIGNGCSKGNAGHFATEQVFPLADKALLPKLPSMLLDPLGPISLSPRYILQALPWFLKFIANMRDEKQHQSTLALRQLNQAAIAAFKPLLAQANAEHLMTLNGSLLVYEDTPISQIKLDYQKYKNAGVNVELLDKTQLQLLEPDLSDAINYALFFTDVGHTINPYQLSQQMASLAKTLGAEFIVDNVNHIETSSQLVKLHLNATEMIFDATLIATGAWSKQLVESLGYKFPIEAERGYHLMLNDTKVLNRPVASAERKFIMTPMQEGLRLAGTVEFAGLAAPANNKRADALYHHATPLIKNIEHYDPSLAKENQRWLGLRPSMPDSLPVIGKAPQHSSVFFALGHQHLGLTWAAITAKLIGQIVANKPTDVPIEPYCISRFN